MARVLVGEPISGRLLSLIFASQNLIYFLHRLLELFRRNLEKFQPFIELFAVGIADPQDFAQNFPPLFGIRAGRQACLLEFFLADQGRCVRRASLIASGVACSTPRLPLA